MEGASNTSNFFLIEDRCFIARLSQLYEITPDNYELELVTTASGPIQGLLPFGNEWIIWSGTGFAFPNPQSYLERFNPNTGVSELIYQVADVIEEVVPFPNGILFRYDTELLFSDGSMNGTERLLKSNSDNITAINLNEGVLLNNQYIFQLTTQLEGSEPWVTDGTVDGTQLLKDLRPGSQNTFANGSIPSHFFQAGNIAYFTAFTEGFELSMIQTDGTPDGTIQVFSFMEDLKIQRIFERFTFNGETYLKAVSSTNGFEWWKTDGTLAGTTLLKDVWPGAGSSATGELLQLSARTKDYLYFNANDGVYGMELWRTDGTNAGTRLMGDLSPGADWSTLFPIGEINDAFYFIEGRGNRGYRLYELNQNNPPKITPYETSYDWFEIIGYNYSKSLSIPFLYNDEMEMDQNNNVYLIGEFTESQLLFYGSEDFIEQAPGEEGSRRNFLASYDTEGSFRWAKEVGGYSFGTEQALAVDSENHVICGGVYRDQGVIGSVILNDPSNRFFLTKLDSDGTIVWTKQGNIGQGFRAEVNYVETDKEGNIYVGGCFTDFGAQLGPNQISAEISPSFFVAKYDKEGNELWLKHLPFPSVELHGFVKSLQVQDQKLYVVITDGDYNWTVPCNFRNFDLQIYVLNEDGEIINDKRFSASDLTFVTDARFSPEGYLHLIGMFRRDLEIDGRTYSTSCEDPRGFVVKLDSNLRFIEAFALETPHTFLQEIEFGANGTYYLSGRQELEEVPSYSFNYFRNNRNKTFVKKYDKLNHLIDERYFGKSHSTFDDSRPLISIDSEENIILSDRYQATFDTLPVNGGFAMNLALLKFSLDQQADYPQDDQLEESSVLLFPNPAQFEITLFSEDEDFQDASLRLYDAMGRYLGNPSIRYDIGIATVDVRHLTPGVYFLQVNLDDRQFTRIFNKMN